MSNEVEIRSLKAGDRIRVAGNDACGHAVTRTGTLLAKPMLVKVKVKAQGGGGWVAKWRMHVDAPGGRDRPLELRHPLAP
ncbi:hypothetical protein ACWC5I_01910 [Kitasatospora sp. NPDC001574]